MKKLYFVLLVLIVTQVFSDEDYFLKHQNNVNLKVCKKYFTDEKFVKTVNLLNGYQMILRNIPDVPDKDGSDPYFQLYYTVVDCFLEKKYLIVDAFMPDSNNYFIIDLRDGERISIDGIPMLSPSREFFLTVSSIEAKGSSSLYRINIYSMKNKKIENVLTTEFGVGCEIETVKWIDDQKISFDVACNYNESRTKSYIEYYNKKWQLIELRRPTK